MELLQKTLCFTLEHQPSFAQTEGSGRAGDIFGLKLGTQKKDCFVEGIVAHGALWGAIRGKWIVWYCTQEAFGQGCA